jgi:hypothetical protein
VREDDNFTTFMCRMAWQSWSLKLLEPSGPHRACYGTPFQGRGAKNPGDRWPSQINFVLRPLVFVAPQYGTPFISPFGSLKFLDDLCSSNCSVKTQQDRHTTHKDNIETLSCNNCCHRKAIHITYSECVSVAIVMQHVKLMRRYFIVICGLSGCITFFYILSHTARFYKKKKSFAT